MPYLNTFFVYFYCFHQNATQKQRASFRYFQPRSILYEIDTRCWCSLWITIRIHFLHRKGFGGTTFQNTCSKESAQNKKPACHNNNTPATKSKRAVLISYFFFSTGLSTKHSTRSPSCQLSMPSTIKPHSYPV